MSDPQMMVVGRRRGRPQSSVPKSHRTLYLPTAYWDRIDQLALKYGVSSSEALTRVVDMAMKVQGISEQNK